MDHRHLLPDWDALATLADDALPLLGTALLIARDEYPDLDAGRCRAQLAAHAEHLRGQVEASDDYDVKLHAINRYLFEEVGYAGNHDDYYDPRNSYLNQVLERRLGNPISLALIQIEVCRRLGLALEGVSFPGHFLVRLPVEDGMLVMDPFNRGRPLGIEELRERARKHLGGQAPDDASLAQLLNPASHRAILKRVLRNLHGLYAEASDWERCARSADRILRLDMEDLDALRDRGTAYLELGHLHGARADLGRYLARSPGARDADQVRDTLLEAGRGAVHLH